jgi:hypothetical protein
MALKPVRYFLTISILCTLLAVVIPSGTVQAMSDGFNSTTLPGLETFVEQVVNGQAGELRGVYIAGILAAPIIRQPDGMDDFVSPWQNVLTQFGMASRFGSTGLLAHNYLAGETYALLREGQEIQLVFGDGRIDTYVISEFLRYQALAPESTSSAFLDLESRGILTYSELFAKAYNRPGQVIFQTCIQTGQDLSWGRLFVIAQPSPE